MVQYFFVNWFLPDWANVCRFLGADETQYASITRKICMSSSYVVSGSVMNDRNASHQLKNENFLFVVIFILLHMNTTGAYLSFCFHLFDSHHCLCHLVVIRMNVWEVQVLNKTFSIDILCRFLVAYD